MNRLRSLYLAAGPCILSRVAIHATVHGVPLPGGSRLRQGIALWRRTTFSMVGVSMAGDGASNKHLCAKSS